MEESAFQDLQLALSKAHEELDKARGGELNSTVCPRELALVGTKLQEAGMWLNAAETLILNAAQENAGNSST